MNQALNIDDLERRIGVHDGLSIDEAMKLVARLRDLERELFIAKGNNAARIDGLQAAISVLEKRAQPAGEAEPVAWRLRYPKMPALDRIALPTFTDDPARMQVLVDAGVTAMPLYAAPPAAANQAGISERERFEAWHNRFYGPQDKYNPIRSLAWDSCGVGLGYDDPIVQAQFVAFCGSAAPHTEPQEE